MNILLRKTCKRILEEEGLDFHPTPNEIIKQAVYAGIISDAETCITLIKQRNLLSHIYDDDEIDVIFEYLQSKYQFLEKKSEEIKIYLSKKHG